jgi:hypothetical protein
MGLGGLVVTNAAKTFQCMMDHMVDNLEAVFPYMDDSLVSSPVRQTHLIHLEAFFSNLAAKGLTINFENVFLPF